MKGRARFVQSSPLGTRSLRRTQRFAWLACGLALLAGCNSEPATPSVSTVKTHYERGADLLRKKDIAGAKGAFEMAIRLDPSYAPAYLALSNIAVNTGDFPGAITQLETLQRAAPQTPHIVCRLAQLRAASGSFLEQMTAAQLALKQEPDCPRAVSQYGLMLVSVGSQKEATDYLRRAHRQEPSNPHITLELARLLARDGATDEAWKLLDSLPVPSIQPVQENAFRGWLLAEVGRGGRRDDKAALALLDQALAMAPENGSANLEKGRILLRAGDAPGAFKLFQKAAQAMPPNLELLSSMAQAGKQLKKPGAAQMEQSARKFATLADELYAARRAYLAEPGARANQMRLARLEAAMGNTYDAQTLVTQMLKQDPNDTEALELLTGPKTGAISSPSHDTKPPGEKKPDPH